MNENNKTKNRIKKCHMSFKPWDSGAKQKSLSPIQLEQSS